MCCCSGHCAFAQAVDPEPYVPAMLEYPAALPEYPPALPAYDLALPEDYAPAPVPRRQGLVCTF